MSIFPLKMTNGLARLRKPSFDCGSGLIDQDLDICTEEFFQGMLDLEIKRSERSGKPFLLLLLDVGRALEGIQEADTLKRISHSLIRSTRETDIKGWYKDQSTLGVIFTEIRQVDREFMRNRILHKVYKNLCKVLDLELLNSIEISSRYFPESYGNESSSDALSTTPAKVMRNPVLSVVSTNPDTESLEDGAPTPSHIGESKTGWFLLAGDLLLILVAVLLGRWIRFVEASNTFKLYPGATILSLLIYPAALYLFDVYDLGRNYRSRETALRMVLGVAVGGFVLSVFFYLIPQWQYGRGIMFLQMAVLATFLTFWRMGYGALFQAARPKVGAIVLGAGKSARTIYSLLESPLSPYRVKAFLDDDPSLHGKVVGSTAILGSHDKLKEVAQQTWAKCAILSVSRNRTPEFFRTILEARLDGIEVVEMPTVYERLTGRVPVQHIEDQWLLFADGFYLISKEYVQKLKRLCDVIISGILLLFSAPLIALTALAIRLDSKGPIFYSQTRVGKGTKVFTVHKFRSMHPNAERQGATWAQKKDPRVTRVGKWIRIFRIDELPQLWNVFKGDMSLIGPRPERPEFVRELEMKIPYYFMRHSVPPGVTGWAQVNYPYGASVEDAQRKLEYDLYYIKNMSLLLDLKILLKTVGVVLLGEGAR